MKFNFKIQQYQTDTVNSVVNCFKGQPYIDNGYRILLMTVWELARWI